MSWYQHLIWKPGDLINIMTWGGGLNKTLQGRTIFRDTADSDQLASSEVVWSGLHCIYFNLKLILFFGFKRTTIGWNLKLVEVIRHGNGWNMFGRCSCLRCLSDRKEQTSLRPMEWFLLPDFTIWTKWIGWNYLSAIFHAGKARTLKLKISLLWGRFRLDLESEFGKGFRHRVLKIIIKLNKLSLQFRTCKINCQNWGFYFIDLKKEEHNAKEQYYTSYFGCRSQDRTVSVTAVHK